MKHQRNEARPSCRIPAAAAILGLSGLLALATGCEDRDGVPAGDDPGGLLADAKTTGLPAADAERPGRGPGGKPFHGERHDGMGEGRKHEGPGGHGGPGALFCRAALEELDLAGDQRAEIEKLVAEAHPAEGEVRPVDIDAHKAARIKALNRLHELLTPAQRGQLVEKMRARHAERMKAAGEGGCGGQGGPGPHPDGDCPCGKQAGDCGCGGKGGPGPHADGGCPFAKDPAGREGRREEHRARMDAFLTAFTGEEFDAAAFAPPPPPGPGAPGTPAP